MKGQTTKNLETITQESATLQDFAARYFDYLKTLLDQMDLEAVNAFWEVLKQARKEENTVFFIGNGGSAASASHMAQDFNVGRRIHEKGRHFRALSLASNNAEITAIANDYGYEHAFLTQLKIHYRPGDVLVAISASGNSPNVIAAAEWMKSQGSTVVGFVGFDGGCLKQLSDVVIEVRTPKGEYGPVEDVHMILDHLIYSWLRKDVYREKGEALNRSKTLAL